MADLDLEGARQRRLQREATVARAVMGREFAASVRGAPIVAALRDLGRQAAQALRSAEVQPQPVIFDNRTHGRFNSKPDAFGWRFRQIEGTDLGFLSADGFLSAFRGNEGDFGAQGLERAVIGRLLPEEAGNYDQGYFLGDDGMVYVRWDDAVYDSSNYRVTRFDHAFAEVIESILDEAASAKDEASRRGRSRGR